MERATRRGLREHPGTALPLPLWRRWKTEGFRTTRPNRFLMPGSAMKNTPIARKESIALVLGRDKYVLGIDIVAL
jgi:hypothetical protein